jgi:hypothetical protein
MERRRRRRRGGRVRADTERAKWSVTIVYPVKFGQSSSSPAICLRSSVFLELDAFWFSMAISMIFLQLMSITHLVLLITRLAVEAGKCSGTDLWHVMMSRLCSHPALI